MITPPFESSAPSHRVHWSDGTVPAVAPVRIRVAGGADVTVDAAAPSRAIAWTIASDADRAQLAAVFRDPRAIDEIDGILNGGSTGSPGDSFFLTPEWTRRAVTEAVDGLCPLELNEATLLLDLAESEQACGQTTAAAAHVALAAPHLEALLEDAAEGEFPAVINGVIERVGRAAAHAVAGTEWGVGISDLVAAVVDRPGLEYVDVDEVLDAWRAQLGLVPAPADHLLGGGRVGRWVPDFAAQIDPACLRPRRARWAGAESAELVVSRAVPPDGSAPEDDGRVMFRAQLPLSAVEVAEPGEIGDLRVYAVRADGSAMVRIARMHRADRDLVAELSVPASEVDALSFGVVEDARGLETVRAGELAGELCQVERYMLEAWSSRRAAGAARLLGPDADRTVDDLLDEASRAGRVAETLLRLIAERTADTSVAAGAGLRARSVAAFLESVGKDPGPGEHPLLAELLPAEVPDSDPDHL